MLRASSHHACRAALVGLAGWLAFSAGGAYGQGKGPTTRSRLGAMPAALVGKWGFAVASGNYCDTFSNCDPGSGGSVTFTFGADGRTYYALFQSSLVDGCGQVRSLTLKTGKASVRGSTLVFTPTAGTYKSVNGCRPDLTGLWKFKPGDLKPVSLRWQLDGNQLRLIDPDGEASGVYSRR
ncbi:MULTISPECIES: hypothetical protein [Mesorhizobium]|uniref:Lipocalin-like domain-containing protein n=5 Tax=Mesorhizobium TaxID=68287 RepID=E8TIY8_MESCW|nr:MULTISPECIES: hypothetical protein [Mesorhizobium]RUZ81435.1 hypothetical protein EN947_19530 [Mesorhizobium sp. M7A.F.Ca.US.003.02.2.1]RVA13792.1 hypothetical protein EN932_07425 [Mesorhizobium sp. M7A.F.Ca.US.002.01.1.1]ADV10184.1 hypothetical protein Mesci_1020 [Mesorhizobium ciceri biovar biserrulae WSM1271]ARP62863.1 hypothetical protein A9K65_005280 [Mesorhizobium sp. WSM1497]MBZ9717236.1 hypothetical protein [Mesorhizobium sp. AD1-1]